MGFRRRGFALLLALLVSAGVFALAIEGGAAARLAMVEAIALRDGAQARRDAASAALLAFDALLDGAGSTTAPLAGATTQSAQQLADALDRPDMPPLPPGLPIRDLLEKLQNKDGKQPETGAADAGATVQTRIARRGALSALRRAGLPAMPIEVSAPTRSMDAAAPQRFRVRFIDAGGLVNVNTADEAQLARVMISAGLSATTAQTLAEQLLDWRDEDSFVRPFGAEREAYERRGVTIRNGPLQSLAEIGYLPAATREIVARLTPLLTTVGDGAIHAPTAPAAVIASAPGMTPEAAARLIESRSAGALDEQTLRAILAPLSEAAKNAIRLAPSGFVAAIVAPVAATTDAARDSQAAPYEVTFEATESGVRDVRVRPAGDFDAGGSGS